MPRLNAAQRRYRVHEPLFRWRTRILVLEKEVRSQMTPVAGAPGRKELVNEVLRLASPHAVSSVDVVIPGGRDDLARHWIAARLAGRGADQEDWRALVLEVARPPDEGTAPYTPQRGPTRYRMDRFQREVTKAAEDFFRDEPPLA